MIRLPALFFAAASLAWPEWTLFRAGPVEVWTDASDDRARELLAHFDQVRWLAAARLGKTEITPLWPVRLILFKPDRTGGRVRTPGLALRRDAYTGGLASGDPIPAQWLRDFAAFLLRDDTRPMPAAIENAFADVFSTVRVQGPRITLGTPPEPARRTREFALLHLILVDPEYSGRVRVFFSNLQQGALFDTACRNAFEIGQKEMNALVDRYFAAGQYPQQVVSGRPLSPVRDYRPRPVADALARVALADLLGGEAAQQAYRAILNEGSPPPEAFEGAGLFAEAIARGSESARAWLSAATAEQDPAKAGAHFDRAIELNPRWAEPHFRRAAREPDLARRVAMLKRAASLDPRNIAYWKELARVQIEAKDFLGAGLSWREAERAAPTEEERLALARERQEFEQQRLDLQAAERKREVEEKARALERLRNEALDRIRAAEQRAAAGDPPADPNRKVVDWWEGPQAGSAVTAMLDRVDCLRGPARLALRDPAARSATRPLLLVVRDPAQIVITGGGELTLKCGPQQPPRRVKIEFNPRPDPKTGTVGEVVSLEFLP